MVEGGKGPSFPVVFYDGEREMDIGYVRINPGLEYKPFQLLISQRIGISPNQISIYLVDRKRNHKAPFSEDRRKIPITGKVNFSLICRQKDCCFLVVLKRSRKARYRRERPFNAVEFSSEIEYPQPSQMRQMPENLVLLRRNQPMPFFDQISQSELADLNGRLERLRIQRENYQMAMGKGDYETDSILRTGDWSAAAAAAAAAAASPTTMMTTNKGVTQKVFCEECEYAAGNGGTTSFHPCVNDAVFTPKLGPIERIW